MTFLQPLKWWRSLGALLLGLKLVFILQAVTVSAQDPPTFYWDFINVDITIQANGDLWVRETQKYVFTDTHTAERYRWIPLGQVDSIEDIQVVADGKALDFTTNVEANQRWIRWSHPLNPPESHTFVLNYRVTGGIANNGNQRQVYWRAIFGNRSAPVRNGQVTVYLPPELAGQIRTFESQGVPTEAQQLDARTVQFVAQQALPPGQEMVVRVSFPPGILAPSSQASPSEPVLSEGPQLAAVVLLMGLLAATYTVWKARYWWFINIGATAETVRQPPSDLPAPAAAYLLMGTVGQGALQAMFMEMCQRRILGIEDVERPTRLNKYRAFKLTQQATGHYPWECRLLEVIPEQLTISSDIASCRRRAQILRRLKKLKPELESDVVAFLCDRGGWPQTTAATLTSARWNWRCFNGFAAVATGLGISLLSGWLMAGIIPGILTYQGLNYVSSHRVAMMQLNRAETGLIQQWKAYQRHLGWQRQADMQSSQFERDFPYAVAFNRANIFLSQFQHHWKQTDNHPPQVAWVPAVIPPEQTIGFLWDMLPLLAGMFGYAQARYVAGGAAPGATGGGSGGGVGGGGGG